MMALISSGLHKVGTELKTTQPRIFYNYIKMQIMLKLSTKDGNFQVFFILSLEFLSAGNYSWTAIASEYTDR